MENIRSAMTALAKQISIDNDILLLAAICLFVITIVLAAALLVVLSSRAMRIDRLAFLAQQQWREDLSTAVTQGGNLLVEKIKTELMQTQRDLGKTLQDQAKDSRNEFFTTLHGFQGSLSQTIGESNRRFDNFSSEQNRKVEVLTEQVRKSIEGLTDRVDGKLKEISEDNERKLEKIRITVEEKLQTSIKDKVTESFESISNRLAEVSLRIGEMHQLAQDVGKIRNVLTNVKTRGTFGEVQLEALLSQFLTPDQYVKNAHPNAEKPSLVVEFAVKLPGVEGHSCYLPIDSKFPMVHYEKMQELYERGDKVAADEAKKNLEADLKKEAKSIEGYLDPPYTTDFGILFLPFEGLYAAALSIPGLSDQLFNQSRVFVMGPSTLASALCAYRAGFESMAIEKKTSEIKRTLAEVREEFGRFGLVIDKLRKNLDTVTKTVNEVQLRTSRMGEKLVKLEKDGTSVPIMANADQDIWNNE